MKREEIFQYVKEQYGTEPEYLWKKDPDSAVLRHKNGKWYAIIMAVEKKTLGLEEDGKINILDVKCDPDLVGMIIQTYGFLPGYHMNKRHWITILLDDSVSEAKTLDFLDMSYDLTESSILEEMGNLVEASLKNLFFSIENKDMQLAERIVADDRNVNNLERSIEAQCLMLITTQQPIAQDLRTVSSILKVVTDIERIGDHASDIAELIQQMDHKQLERYSGHLQPMIAASREMVHEAVSAFVARDHP